MAVPRLSRLRSLWKSMSFTIAAHSSRAQFPADLSEKIIKLSRVRSAVCIRGLGGYLTTLLNVQN